MSAVAFLDLGHTYRELKPEIDVAVARVLSSGFYILSDEVKTFERSFAAYVEAKECVGVGNGLDALTLVLRAWGIAEGDEVIVPSNTYIATWLAVTNVGATPVPVEPRADFTLDVTQLASKLTPRTRAILPVHLYGACADMQPLLELAQAHDLRVLEDAAQAHGARYRGRKVGALGHATAWSFYPTKNLGAFGDAGAITTNDAALADKLRLLRNYGSRVKYENELIGQNSRLDPLQAAILNVKLAKLDEWNARRAAQASVYLTELGELAWLRLPQVDAANEPAWHVFVVRCAERDQLQAQLAQAGIQTLIHYPIPPHLQPAYASFGHGPGSFPRSEQIHREVLSLPIGPHLTREQAASVARAVCAFH